MRIERLEWDGRDPRGLAARLRSRDDAGGEVARGVAEIIAGVRERGDAAVRELEGRYGAAEPERLRVDGDDLERARDGLDPALADALDLAVRNVARVAEAQLPPASDPVAVNGHGVALHERPVGGAGIYAPGGRAAYPSSVVMGAIPARVAGVRRIALASPPGPDGVPDLTVLAAAACAGVDEVYAMGGAQAIAALALGTESVDPVDVIAGPGNRFVTEAKRQVFGTVGIDGLEGPSELVVIADRSAPPRWIALDLLAQAEHGPDSPLFLLTQDAELLEAVAELVADLAPQRSSVTDATLAVVCAPGLEAALALSDALAPEHLQLALEEAGPELAAPRVAGCVFLGPAAGAAFGDYAAGSNHVLPTGGAARFGGPLGPRAFMRRTAVVSIDRGGVAALAPAVDVLARAEGLPVHGESAAARSEDNPPS